MKFVLIYQSILLFKEMNANQQIEFTFKLIYTEEKKTYSFNPNITITNFIDLVKHQAYNDFNIYNGYNIEIIETGQYYNINGRNPEEAPALIPEHNTSLREKYGNNNYNVSFYIRIVIR
jgi:hypothetical protein